MRRAHAWVLAAGLSLCGTIRASPVPSSPKLKASIAPQSLAKALTRFTQQTGLQYGSESIGTQSSRGASRGAAPAQALAELLECTGLAFEFLNSKTFRVYVPASPVPVDPRCETAPARLSEDLAPLDQITVTATRREERSERVPISIFVWTADAMEAAGIKSMSEIGALTPGVEYDFLSSVGSGVYTNLAIRGVTDRHGTVTAIFLDDVEIPTVRSNTSGRALPSSFDLERVEVLRGPQGTLLGPDTQGGAIRFIPTAPSLTESVHSAHAEWAATVRGQPSYEAGAVSGGPITESELGYRVSAWYRSDGGYIDRVDPFTGAVVDADADRTVSKSARGALTLTPPESMVSITPTIDYESTDARDSRSFFTYLSNPGAGELNNGSLIRQPANDEVYLATLKLTADLVPMKASSLTAYFDRNGSLLVDDTESMKWGGFGNRLGLAYPKYYSDAIITGIDLTQQLFSQQLQIESKDPDAALTWLAAAVYSRQHYHETDQVVGQRIPDGTLTYVTNTQQTQYAAFGTVTRRLIDRLSVTGGLRLERDQYDAVAVSAPPSSSRHAETLAVPALTLSYEADEHSRYYFSAAKGYSPAGADAALSTCFSGLTVYPTDTIGSYELGAKVALLGDRAHLDAAAFHQHWNNGPVAIGNCLFTHMPGGAVSNGFEMTLQTARVGPVNAGLALAYTDARYTDTVRADGVVIVRAGDAVGTPPLVTSPWNVTAWLERRIALNPGWVVLRGEDIVHSRNPGPFYTSDPASPYYAPGLLPDPATNLFNVRVSLLRERFDVALFVNNVFDSQPTLLQRNKGNDTSNLYYATTFKPRTVGLSGTWQF